MSGTLQALTFELFAFRFQFRALEYVYFPPGKAGNIVRGALGRTFRKFACAPSCSDARLCSQRDLCAYARLFEPVAVEAGPSGFHDWPRPFVIRAAHLDACRVRPQEIFHFDLCMFQLHGPALAYFAFSFLELVREGLGPGRAKVELAAVHSLTASGEVGTKVFDGGILGEPQSITLSLASESGSPGHVRIVFLTPTELKEEGRVVRQPEFRTLFARVRDRILLLRRLYGGGPLPLDFAGSNARAASVKLVNSSLRWETSERRSGRTGQTHSLGGLMGWADYEGELDEFVPYLKAAYWTGVGRQTTWGKGQIKTEFRADR